MTRIYTHIHALYIYRESEREKENGLKSCYHVFRARNIVEGGTYFFSLSRIFVRKASSRNCNSYIHIYIYVIRHGPHSVSRHRLYVRYISFMTHYLPGRANAPFFRSPRKSLPDIDVRQAAAAAAARMMDTLEAFRGFATAS